jgi:hypothetical protein
LAGATRASAGLDIGFGGLSVNDTGLGIAAGGGLDLNAGEHLAVRVFQVDYPFIRAMGENGNNARLSAGLVIKID